MSRLNKFEDVDVSASLNAIMKQNTGFYQSDFDIDKEIIAKAVASPDKEDKTLLWFCRPSGTHCFRERDVFLKDTAPHNTWRFYMEQTSDRILAYAIELTGRERGKIKGSLYELDYAKHYERVKDKALAADTVKLIYERGEQMIPAGQYFSGSPDPQLGKFERFETVPNDPDALQWLLQEERRNRELLFPGDFKAHIAALHDGLIETEARRIVREMKRHDTPNSPDKSHFMVELDPAFMRLASTKDIDCLFSMLLYKTISFSKIEGRYGTYAMIDKGENRDREIKKLRPSVRAQLKADKAKVVQNKTVVKKITHFLEERKFTCHWHKNLICEHELNCQSCKYQPDDNEKPNGKNVPILIKWETDFAGTMPVWPACGEMPYGLDRCIFCGQKFIKDERAKEWEQPQKVERMDCPVCGGKDTMEFTRSKYNGHKHGCCTACGTKFME